MESSNFEQTQSYPKAYPQNLLEDDLVCYSEYGEPVLDKRLSDKLLSAHNHAYAIGEIETADILLLQLKQREERELAQFEQERSGPIASQQRRRHFAAPKAEQWREYIDSRNIYNSLLVRSGTTPQEAASAAAALKKQYARWILT